MSVERDRGRIVVLGMHRSGTSCVGELLVAMGAYFGPQGIGTGGSAENPHGLFERRDLRRVCHFLLQRARAEWWTVSRFAPDRVPAEARAQADEMLAAILADLDGHRPWFIKEPRLCLLLPILQKRLGKVVTVCVWRDPMEVAESLRKRDGFPTGFGIALWESYVRSTFAACTPDAIVSYNRLVADPTGTTRQLFEELTALGIAGLRMPGPERLAQVVDPALRRSHLGSTSAQGLLTSAQRQLLAALQSGDPTSSVFTTPMSSEQTTSLAAWEQARRVQMRAAAYQSLAEAKRRVSARPLRTRLGQAVAALGYLPWNPVQWLKWHRRGKVRQRVSQHMDACAIAASGAFDPAWYLQRYPDVAGRKVDPLLHFVRYGAAEGRDPTRFFATKQYLQAYLDAADVGKLPAASQFVKQHA